MNVFMKQKRADFFATKLSKINETLGGKNSDSTEGQEESKTEKPTDGAEPQVKEVYMIKCPKCGKSVERDRVVKKKYICYECGGYFRVKVPNRIRMVADPHTFEPWFTDTPVHNPLAYAGYEEKLAEAREKTGLDEAVTVGRCKVFGEDSADNNRLFRIDFGLSVSTLAVAEEGFVAERHIPVFEALPLADLDIHTDGFAFSL